MPKYYLVPAEILFHNNMSKGYIEDLIKANEVKVFEKEYPISESTIIQEKSLDELCEMELKMLALEGAGVDNWEGYDIAMGMFEDMKNEQE